MSAENILDVYLIGLKNGRVALFSPSDAVEACEARSGDHVRRCILWLSSRRFRVLAWLGRVFQSAHGYYVKLESRLDPVERVLKAMAEAQRYRILYSDSWNADRARKQFQGRLRGQSAKHLVWFVTDLVLSAGSLAIAWIPGPNIVGWYPFLRSLSHYRAFRGASKAMNAKALDYESSMDLRRLEDSLKASGFSKESLPGITQELGINGLEQFLERMI